MKKREKTNKRKRKEREFPSDPHLEWEKWGGRKQIFFVFYHACLLTWLVIAPLVNGLAMWPRTTRGRPALLGAAAVAGCLAIALAAPALGLPLNSNHYFFTVPYLFGLSVNLLIGRALVRSTGDPIDQARFLVIELFAGTVSLVFTLFMQR